MVLIIDGGGNYELLQITTTKRTMMVYWTPSLLKGNGAVTAAAAVGVIGSIILKAKLNELINKSIIKEDFEKDFREIWKTNVAKTTRWEPVEEEFKSDDHAEEKAAADATMLYYMW